MRVCVVLLVVAAAAGPVVGKPAARIVEVWTARPGLMDIEVTRADGRSEDATPGMTLSEADRIRTGFKCRAKLDFGNKAAVVVEELSDVKVGVFALGQASQVQLWLKMGEVQAQVRKETGARTHFEVKSPSSTASVRGTTIESIMYTPHKGMSIRMGSEGSLLATRLGEGSVVVEAGEKAMENAEGDRMETPAEIKDEESRAQIQPEGLSDDEEQATEQQPSESEVTPRVGAVGASDSVFDVDEATFEAVEPQRHALLHLFQVGSEAVSPGRDAVEGHDPVYGITCAADVHDEVHASFHTGHVADCVAKLGQHRPAGATAGDAARAINHAFDTLDPHDWVHARLEHTKLLGDARAIAEAVLDHQTFHQSADAHDYIHRVTSRLGQMGTPQDVVEEFHEAAHDAFEIPR